MRPLVLEGERQDIGVVLERDDRQLRFALRACSNEGVDGDEYATGWAWHDEGRETAPATVDVRGQIARARETRAGDACYRLFESLGISYGPSMRGLRAVHLGDRSAICEIELPAGVDEGPDDLLLDPTIMDGALQSVLVLLDSVDGGLRSLQVPFALDRLETWGRLPKRCYGMVTLLSASTPRAPKVSITLTDHDGRVLARLGELSVRPVREPASPDKATTLLLAPQWQEAPLANRSGLAEVRTLLVFDGDGGLAQEMRQELARGGAVADVVSVTRGDRFGRRDARTYTINPERSDGFDQLLQDMGARGAWPGHIVQAWPLNRHGAAERPGDGFRATFLLTQALLRHRRDVGGGEAVRLLYAFAGGDALGQAEHAAFGGFARSLRIESPGCRFQTVCLPANLSHSQLLLAELGAATDDGVEVSYRGGARFVKSYRELDAPSQDGAGATLRDGGVFLVTGGAGGLGRIVGTYLAQHRRGRIVLAGRSELTGEQRRQMRALETAGADVTYMRADVTDRGATQELVDRVLAQFGRLNGVIHAAGVVRDGFILRSSSRRHRCGHRTKAGGAGQSGSCHARGTA